MTRPSNLNTLQSSTTTCYSLPLSLFLLIPFALTFSTGVTQETPAKPKKLPRASVIDVPAIRPGLCVSNLFQTNMVIQRDKPFAIWGWATPGEKVTVRVGGRQLSTSANDDRTWKITFPAYPASDRPSQMTIKAGKKQILLNNILVGDVWVLGGQSNMEFPLSRIENGELEIVSANFPQIRILTVPAQNGPQPKPGFPRLHEWSSWSSRHFRKGDWDVCSPEIVRELSAIGYVFGRRLHMTSRVPIGIIDASRGGTTIETWTPDSVLRSMESETVKTLLNDWDQRVAAWDPKQDLEDRIKRFHQRVERFKKEGRALPANEKEPDDLRPGPAMDQNRPGNCYASMIAPLSGFQVRGVIFHQGYNNCFNGTRGAVLYRQVFPEMIRSWRKAFSDPKLPFGILSLCTEGTAQNLENYTEMMVNAGPYIRDAQFQTFLEQFRNGDQNIGFVSTYDLRRRWYHPQLKIPAGERIARWALATQYGQGNRIRWKPPLVDSVTVVDGQIRIRFDEPVSPIDDGSPIVGFAVAGNNRQFHPAQADFLVTGKDNRGRPIKDSRTLVLDSPMVKKPVHFRYAWGRSPLGNLQASRQTDIPVPTLRSDDWPLENIPLGMSSDDSPELDRGLRRKLIEANRNLDLQRRLHAARELLKANPTNESSR